MSKAERICPFPKAPGESGNWFRRSPVIGSLRHLSSLSIPSIISKSGLSPGLPLPYQYYFSERPTQVSLSADKNLLMANCHLQARIPHLSMTEETFLGLSTVFSTL